jgi:transketolase
MTASGKDTPKSNALHLDDFSVKQDTVQHSVPKYYGEALLAAARANRSILALTADLTAPTETDLVRDHLPNQFIMAGIAEANMVGVGAGLARAGFIPFVHSFSVFLSRRSFDQIAMQVAYPKTNVKLVGFMPGIDSLLGVSHQAIDDIALMRTLPNMTVLEPASPADYEDAVAATLAHEGPVYLRLYRATKQDLRPNNLPSLHVGKIRCLHTGSDAAIFATGLMVEQALHAAINLKQQGITASVIDCASIKPLDTEGILNVIKQSKIIVTAENHSVVGGLGSAIAEVMASSNIARPFFRIGVQDCFAEGGSRDFLFKKYGLTADAITAKIKQAIPS